MNEKIREIILKLKNHHDQILAITWVAKDYSKLDLIKELEELIKNEKK